LCLWQPEAFRVVAATAGEKGLREDGIEGLLARPVGGTMGQLPVVNAWAMANSQAHGEALAMWKMGYCTAARMVLLMGHEDVDDENAGRTASLAGE
jgi:hypothetical protein